ncbi:MAG: hypothetical protein LBT59_30030 [Clostridiales bacterium]|jgi:hypothetical protein|nr:hypothetical protein [Clostridiales bacterium]
MSSLYLSSSEKSLLANAIAAFESKDSKNYAFLPAISFEACTCQGTCDGRTSNGGCTWG